jgi:hypothetical protein
MPNFTLLDLSRPEIAGRRCSRRVLQSSDVRGLNRRSQRARNGGPTCWPTRGRTRDRDRATFFRVKQAFYRLRDEPRATILIACSECDWKAAFSRDDLIGSYGTEYLMTDLLAKLASPTCSNVDHHWDRCGAYYVEQIDR